MTWATVALLGALGALARFEAGARIARLRPSDFPWSTFAVNLSGGFALGVLVGLEVADAPRLIVGVGLLGSYTTFSTWMVEAQRLGEDGEWALLWLYLLGSMGAGLAAAGGGWLLGGLLR